MGFKPQHTVVVASAMVTCLCAQAQVQVYGTVDVGIGQMANQDPGPPTTAVTNLRGVQNGGVTTSFLGFRGTEDLGGGLSAKFQIESFLRVDTGEAGRFNANPTSGADVFWGREVFLGLAGSFGEIRLGANANPAWLTTLQVSAMGANSRFSPWFRQLFNSGTRGRSVIDTEMLNSVRYVLPALGGLSGSVAIQAGEGRGSGNNLAANFAYRFGNLSVSLGMQRARHVPGPSLNIAAIDQDMWIVGVSYNFGSIRALVSWAEVDNVSNRSKLPQVGFTAGVGPGTLQFSMGRDTNKAAATGGETSRETTSLGYVYPMSKRTDLYAFLMNEKFPVVGAGKKTGDSYLTGIRHAF